jgi:thiamine pyrophosphate-dependent acetolactate synthase large subunit-like protein
MDVQARDFDWDWDYRPSSEFVPLLEEAASTEALLPIVEALASAERPVIIGGRGAKVGGARDAIIELADRTGALLATSLQAKGLFEGHEFDVGIAGSFGSAPTEELLAEADFVLGIGAAVGYFTAEGGLLFPGAEVARIDIAPAPRELGSLPGRYVRGDALKTTEKLVRLLAERQIRKDGFRNAKTRESLASPPFAFEKAADGLDQRVVMQALSRAVPDNAIVTCGVGHYFGFVASHLNVPGSVDFIFTCQFGAIGQTLANAIGIGIGTPGRPHIVIEGDGSLMFLLAELDTAIRHKVPMVVLILNDGGYGAEVHKLRAKGFGVEIAQHGSPDLVGLARAFGGDGVVLESEDDVVDAVRCGLAGGGLFLIDARVSPSTMTNAYRRLHFGEPNRAPLLRVGAGA